MAVRLERFDVVASATNVVSGDVIVFESPWGSGLMYCKVIAKIETDDEVMFITDMGDFSGHPMQDVVVHIAIPVEDDFDPSKF